jgi:ribosome-associated protein
MDTTLLISEITYRTSRSGGAGGQHVNKVETKVEAVIDLVNSRALTEVERTSLLERLAQQIHTEGCISVTDQTTRSQLENKARATKKLVKLLEKGLIVVEKRKVTRVPHLVKVKRIEGKRRRSEIKEMRKKLL